MTTRKNTRSTIAAGYSRFSSDLQVPHSIETQQAECRKAAGKNGHNIAADLEFHDDAISGAKFQRHGLDAMLAAAHAGRFRTIYFYSLSRLARESVISMPILKRLVHVNKVRVISVTEGIDSDRDGWELIVRIVNLQHECFISDLSRHIRRGQQVNIDEGLSVGDCCFGYKTKPVKGSQSKRQGRHVGPHKIYEIDPEKEPWVRKIFAG